jgi:uncharacterized protein
MWSAYAGQLIYLDSNIVIYALEESSDWPDAVRALLDAIDASQIRAVTSELTLAEVMTKPLQSSSPEHLSKYKQFLSPTGALWMPSVSRDVLTAVAALRATTGLKLFDAIHVATAQSTHCDYFLTQDERLGRALADRPKWLKLSEIN